MHRSLPALLASIALLAGCSCGSGPDCGDVLCGPCPDVVSIRVHVGSAAGPVTVEGADVSCVASDPGTWVCTGGTVAPGAHAITVSAPGLAPRSLSFTIGAAPAGCCTCPVGYTDEITLTADATDGGAGDASVPADAGASDAAPSDASPPRQDASTCNPDAVRFPMGGALEEGTLCDDVFVCVADADAAARVMAASSRFACSSTPEGGCSGVSCAYADPGGPSTLDADEIAEICAVTLVEPTPDMVCRVYL